MIGSAQRLLELPSGGGAWASQTALMLTFDARADMQ